jgi:CubicO group peptidase (beta-lactamase class C family)
MTSPSRVPIIGCGSGRRWAVMTLAAISLSLAAAGLGAESAASAPFSPTASATVAPALSNFEAVDEYARTQLDQLSLPGLALAIVHHDQVVHLAGFGHADPTGRPVTPQTAFMINSVSKSFAGVAVLQLVEAGTVDLDTAVVAYLPQFRLADRAVSSTITVRQLLSHTSGIPESASYDDLTRKAADGRDLAARVARLATVTTNRPPGTTYEYSDPNYDVAGLLVQQVSGTAYPDYVRDHILRPLAMDRTGTTRPQSLPPDLADGYRMWLGHPVRYDGLYAHALLPSGDLISTAEDLSHYLVAQLGGGSYRGAAVLSPERIAASHRPAVQFDDGAKGYGIGWETRTMDAVPVVRHSGTSQSYYSDLVLETSGGWGIAVLTNTNSFNVNGGRIQGLSAGILAILHGHAPPPVPMPHHPILLPLVAIVVAVAFLQALAAARRGYLRLRGRSRRPTRRRALLVLTLCAGWAGLLLVAVPAALYPLPVLLIDVPDVGWSLVLAAAVSAAHALTLLAGCRRAPTDPAPAAGLIRGSHEVPSAV